MGVWSPQALGAKGCLHSGCLYQWSRALLQSRGRGALESELAYDDHVHDFGGRCLSHLGYYALTPSASLERKVHAEILARCLAQTKPSPPQWWPALPRKGTGKQTNLKRSSSSARFWLQYMRDSFSRLMGQQSHRGQCHTYSHLEERRVRVHPQSPTCRSRCRVARVNCHVGSMTVKHHSPRPCGHNSSPCPTVLVFPCGGLALCSDSGANASTVASCPRG